MKNLIKGFINARAELRAERAVRADEAVTCKLQELGASELVASLAGSLARSIVCAGADVHIVVPALLASRFLPAPLRVAATLGIIMADSYAGTLAVLESLEKDETPTPETETETDPFSASMAN